MMQSFFKVILLLCLFVHMSFGQDGGARTIEQAFKDGYLNGHFGAYAQQSSNKESSFVDLNMSLLYETMRFKGYKIGAEAWLNAKIFEQNDKDFARNKDIFTITRFYGDFYNQYEKFGARIGRYGINEEWMKNNTEGFSVDYDGLQNISLNFTWAFRNAYTQNYFNSGFRRMYRVIGAMSLRGIIQVPLFPLKITPYFYFAPGVFFAPALKAQMNLPLPNEIYLRASTHFLTYIQDRGWYGANAGAGFLSMFEGSIYWNGLEGGVGLSATDADGASRIDAFGQSTMFERPVGMFWGGAITLYAFMKYDLSFLSIHGALRNTFINSKNVFNWELKVSGTPLEAFRGLELGIAAIGMNNTSDAIDYFAGKEYVLFRAFVQYKF